VVNIHLYPCHLTKFGSAHLTDVLFPTHQLPREGVSLAGHIINRVEISLITDTTSSQSEQSPLKMIWWSSVRMYQAPCSSARVWQAIPPHLQRMATAVILDIMHHPHPQHASDVPKLRTVVEQL